MSRHGERRGLILWLTVPIVLTAHFTASLAHGGPSIGMVGGLEMVFWGALFRTRLASDAQALSLLNMMIAVHALFSLVYPYYPSPRTTWFVAIFALVTALMAARFQFRWRDEDREAVLAEHEAGPDA